ncbi:MAG: putative lipoprotein [Candidatus Tokpelaia sp. JSC188]|nr:MAG: putative lipoprotein [Candidatus Tokpelaia sp. JSC188]
MNRIIVFFALLITPILSRAWTDGLAAERPFKIAKGYDHPQVALTLDLCMNRIDHRIFDLLISQKIPATLFVTGLWLRKNSDIVEKIRAYPELFEIGNHGANHIPPIDDRNTVYGIKTAGGFWHICEEIIGGMRAIEQAHLAFLQPSRWYRGATALYSRNAITIIGKLGFCIAGFSVNADEGASLPADEVIRRMKTAKDGDVIIAHMNQPLRASGKGVAEGIMFLKQRGYSFVKLSDAATLTTCRTKILYKSCAEIVKDQKNS